MRGSRREAILNSLRVQERRLCFRCKLLSINKIGYTNNVSFFFSSKGGVTP